MGSSREVVRCKGVLRRREYTPEKGRIAAWALALAPGLVHLLSLSPSLPLVAPPLSFPLASSYLSTSPYELISDWCTSSIHFSFSQPLRL